MLAVNSEPFDSPDFLYEVKWDGYRCLAYLEANKTVLRSRNQREITPVFPELAGLHNHVRKRPALLDGEIVIFQSGLPSFAALQARAFAADPEKTARLAGKAPALLITFDLLYSGGVSCLREPLEKRKEILAEILVAGGPAVISEFISGRGREFFRACAERGLEGVVAKRLGSPYLPGKRSLCWRKFRHTKEIDLVICGYQKGRGGRKLGSLVVAESAAGKLLYRGKVGSGLDREEERRLLELLPSLEIKTPPLDLPPQEGRGVLWVKPALVCAVNFLGLTGDGLLRHPVYRGLRFDKIFFEDGTLFSGRP